MFMPGSLPVTPADWRRKRIAINVSFFWLLFPLLDLAGSHPGPVRAALALVPAAVFVAIYNWLPRERHPPRLACGVTLSLALLVAIAAVLTVAERPSWSLLFVPGTGNGLAGLRERARRVAGTVEAGPAPEGGFRLCVTVPRSLAT
jgi:hypothetical protein